jgi:hypothetical protein
VTVKRNPQDQYFMDEAQAFVDAHPDYEPSRENQKILFDRLEAKNLDLDRNTLAQVWKELKAERTIN